MDEVNCAVALDKQEPAKYISQLEAENEQMKKMLKTTISDMKYYLENNEENGVVYVPKFVVEKIVK